MNPTWYMKIGISNNMFKVDHDFSRARTNNTTDKAGRLFLGLSRPLEISLVPMCQYTMRSTYTIRAPDTRKRLNLK